MAAGIVNQCNETVQMAVLDKKEAVFIAKVECRQAVRMVSTVGSRLPAHLTSVGKMLLSGVSDQEVIDLYDGKDDLPLMTANSISSVRGLLVELADVRRRGLAYDDCESNVDVSCVAASGL